MAYSAIEVSDSLALAYTRYARVGIRKAQAIVLTRGLFIRITGDAACRTFAEMHVSSRTKHHVPIIGTNPAEGVCLFFIAHGMRVTYAADSDEPYCFIEPACNYDDDLISGGKREKQGK